MPQPEEKKLISPEEYFKTEQLAEYKNEYYHGEIFAMTGASFHHNLIAGNIFASLHSSLRNSDCVAFIGDMKIQIEADSHYTYPDISVVCGDIEFVGNRDDIIANPFVIIEILSESTKSYDRGDKFNAYRKIRSLRDYILVDQYACHIEYFFKNKAGRWELDEFENPNDSFKIWSVSVELSLEAIYYRVRF
ncbi:Uma2 family endonuclease [Desulfonema magnum]|uniref:Restriction endonuclease, DUF820 n=1 Tax=Desulfonema magnum TaxID=45655 RepID=A0A975BIS9_9BACT|nr:Uma2 family endonuclease [Desulfonema magnum]QTA86479.1 Putative restriction endonuclease, DUF820 [Desulfonema magnum]